MEFRNFVATWQWIRRDGRNWRRTSRLRNLYSVPNSDRISVADGDGNPIPSRHQFLLKKILYIGLSVAIFALFNKIFVFAIVPNNKYISLHASKYIEDCPLDTNASLEALSKNLNQQQSQTSHTNQILSSFSSQFHTVLENISVLKKPSSRE